MFLIVFFSFWCTPINPCQYRLPSHWLSHESSVVKLVTGWSVMLRCCRLQLLGVSSYFSRTLEDLHTSYMSAANWIGVCINEPCVTKGLLGQLKDFSSPHPGPTLEVLSTLTACCLLLIIPLYSSALSPAVGHHRTCREKMKKTEFACSAVPVNISVLTQGLLAWPVILIIQRHPAGTVPTHTHNRIILHTQCSTKTNTIRIHHTEALSTLWTPARNKHTYYKHLLP